MIENPYLNPPNFNKEVNQDLLDERDRVEQVINYLNTLIERFEMYLDEVESYQEMISDTDKYLNDLGAGHHYQSILKIYEDVIEDLKDESENQSLLLQEINEVIQEKGGSVEWV
jgi:hypothetical protein